MSNSIKNSIKEKYIKTSPEPVTLKGTKNILNQMNDSVCRKYIKKYLCK